MGSNLTNEVGEIALFQQLVTESHKCAKLNARLKE